jgi:hypothetical protein
MAVLAVGGDDLARPAATTLDGRDGGDGSDGGLELGVCGHVLSPASLRLDQRDEPCGNAGFAVAREQLRERPRLNRDASV